MRRAGTCTHELAMNAFLAPNATLPNAVESKATNWTKDPTGHVWRVQDVAGGQVWTRRGTSNAFDVTPCTGRACGVRTLSILRSNNRIMVVRGARPSDALIYLGMRTGPRVSGLFPAGPWPPTSNRETESAPPRGALAAGRSTKGVSSSSCRSGRC